MNDATTHDLDKLSDFFVSTFPQMNRDEQMLARAIYQQLALSDPLSLERLANNQSSSTHDPGNTRKMGRYFL